MPFQGLIPALAVTLLVVIMPIYVHGQTSTPCTASMLNSFTPCMSFVTNSSANGTSPTPDCCSSLRSLTTNGTDCMCLIATGSVPFQIPINRTLAISLPRACNMPGVPLQCKASVPAPGPVALGPTLSPIASPPPSPTGSTVPEAASPALAPPSTTVSSEAPGTNSGSTRPVLTPSAAANPSRSLSTSLLLAVLGAIVLKYY